MRTTLTIDDDIAAALKKAAHRSGKPFKQVVNQALRAGLASKGPPSAGKPYRIQPVALGPLLVRADLDKAVQLADALEDEEIARKLELRK